MKKVLIVLTLFAFLCIIGCGNAKNENTDSVSDSITGNIPKDTDAVSHGYTSGDTAAVSSGNTPIETAEVSTDKDAVITVLTENETEKVAPTGTFKVTVIDDGNFIYDKRRESESYYAPGSIIKFHSYPITDVDLAMYVDGVFYSKERSVETDDGYIWEFTYTMEIKPVTIEFKIESGGDFS